MCPDLYSAPNRVMMNVPSVGAEIEGFGAEFSLDFRRSPKGFPDEFH